MAQLVLAQPKQVIASFTHSEIAQGVEPRRVKALVDAGWIGTVQLHRIIPARTFNRRLAHGEPLKRDEADAVGRLVRIRQFAIETLETAARADRWLAAPNPALGGNIPLELAETDAGAREVEAVLSRFAHGDYA